MANLLCKQRDVFIFPATPGTLAASQLGLPYSHLTLKASKTVEAQENSGKIRWPHLSRVEVVYTSGADPQPPDWFNQLQ